MATRRDFVAQFDPQFHDSVGVFASRISSTDADVVITMARKATCFVDALATLNLVTSQRPIYSDRILDMDLTFLRGQHVLLVDDVVISGTTMYEATQRLMSAGATVTSVVVGVDRESWSPALVQPQEPYLSLTNQASMALCAEIVTAISLIPRPYNVDWPLATIRLPNRFREQIHKVSGFSAADVTTSLQARHGITAYTCVPEPWLQNAIDGSFGWPTGRFAQLMKVRLYVSPLPAGSEFTVRVVPLFSFVSLRNDELDQLWTSMLLHLPGFAASLTAAFTTRSSRLRLLQFLISARYGTAWTDRLQRGIRPAVRFSVEKAQADYIFTPDVASQACRASAMADPLFEDVPIFDQRALKPPRSHVAALEVTQTPSLQQQLTRPFTDLFEQKERKARELAKRFGPAALQKPSYRRLMARLKVGYSMSQLVDLLRRSRTDDLSEDDAFAFVSLWLDLALDSGIAVPVTAEQNSTLVRAFRHGEDVHFGDAEEHLCWVLLDAAARAWHRPTLPRVVTEKILVTFIRYGVIKSTLHRWEDGRLGDPDTVGVRFALHGAVVRSGARELFGEEQGLALTDRLASAGRIRRARQVGSRKSPWIVGEPRPSDHLPVTASEERDARLLGLMIGRRLTMPKDEGFTSADLLTLLATCGPEADVPSALAAEVNIVSSRINELVSRFNNPQANAAHNLRFMADDDAVTAANSGRWKFTHGHGRARQVWLDLLRRPTGDEFNDESWNEVIDSITQGVTYTRDTEVSRLINSMGAWLHSASLSLRVLRLLALDSLPEDQRKQFRDRADDVLLRCVSLAGEARSALPRLLSQNQLVTNVQAVLGPLALLIEEPSGNGGQENLLRHASPNLNRLDAGAKQRLHHAAIAELRALRPAAFPLIDETRARGARHGGLRRVTIYTGALRVEVAHPDDAANPEIASVIHNAIERYRRISRSVLDTLPAARNSSGWTVVCAHRDAWRHLARAAAAIATECATVPGLRIAIIGDLPRQERLYQGVDSTEPYGTGFFRRINIVSSAFAKAPARQLHVVSLDEVDESRASRVLDEFLETVGDAGSGLNVSSEGGTAYARILPGLGSWSAVHARGVLNINRTARVERTVDIGIITVLVPEARAVTELLRSNRDYEKVSGRRGRTYHLGALPVSAERFVTVVATRCLDPNESSAGIAYSDLVKTYQAKLIVLVGIAGSIHKDVGLGDVVIASEVIQYDRRKEGEQGIQRRGDAPPLPAAVRRRVADFFEDHDTVAELRGPNGAFKVHTGPIGTGSAVIGNKISDIRMWLTGFNDKTAAVETEAGGVVTPFYERAEEDGVMGFCIIRGISDRADRRKNDDWHTRASENAARTLQELVPYLARLMNDSADPAST